MPKNIVVCCDGTANQFSEDRTNVVKLFYTLVHGKERQVAFYHPGVGTMEAVGAVTSWAKWVTKILGLAFGYGLERDIGDAYIFIMKNFEPGDKVYLFGFSRGAYTARAVASLLHMYGLIPKDNEPLVPYAIRLLTAIRKLDKRSDNNEASPRQDESSRDPKVAAIFKLAEDFKKTFSHRECTPHFVGVWDTVSSVGWIENPLRLPYSANNPDIAIGRHAISIDEKRAFFRTNLWRAPNPPGNPPEPVGPVDVKQVWFAGVHCDVGGGYAESESGLAKIPLQWMLREAEAAGLLVDPARHDEVLGLGGSDDYVKPDPNGMIHESLEGAWWIAEIIPKRHWDYATKAWGRRMNLARRRTIPRGALIHRSVYQRTGYKPELPDGATPVD